MIELIKNIFINFSLETGIIDLVKDYSNYWFAFLFFIGLLNTLLGFKTYRVFFPIIVFMSIVVAYNYIMKDYTDWGTITTTFSVLGTFLGLLSYRWKYLGAGVVSFLIGTSTVYIYYDNIFISIITGIVSTIFTLYLPVIGVSLFTSLFGGIILGEFFSLKAHVVIIIVILGFLIQLFMNRNQKLFEKEYPERLIHLIESKRKEGVEA